MFRRREVDASDDDNGGGAFDDSSEDSSNDDAGDYGGYDFGQRVLWHWEHRKTKIEHDYAITGWALSVMADICRDVDERIDEDNGKHRDAIERVVKRLHEPPCPNTHPEVLGKDEGAIVDMFWNEFKAFRNCTHPFHEPSRWATPDALAGRSHLWHEKYSLPRTAVLGYVACRVMSKLGGIGPAERSWAGVKQIKDGKKSHLGSDSTEKRAILLVTAKIKEAKIRRDIMEKIDASGPDAMFGDDDINFDLQLENFGINTSVLRQPVVQRIFRAWVEDWEQEDRHVMILLQRLVCSQSTRILSLMILIRGRQCLSGTKTWSFGGVRAMDGWSLPLLQMKMLRMSLLL